MKDIKKPNNQEKRRYRTTKLTIDDKVKLFEQYLNDKDEDGEIITDTVYKGYPIGSFLMNIRVEVKREDKIHKFSKENLEKLNQLGLLDDRHESTIDEKVDRLVDFIKQYPQLWDANTVDYTSLSELEKHVDEFLKKQEQGNEQKQDLIQKLKQAEKDYMYIRNRLFRGKLSKEYQEKLREGKVGRRIGYTKEIEELAKGQPNEKAFKKYLYLCDKNYGGLDNFKKYYIQQIIETGSFAPIPYIENLKPIHFDISSPNFQNEEYDKLCFQTKDSERTFGIFDGQKLKELMNTILNEKEKSVLNARYGLNGQEILILDKVGEAVGVKRERARQIEQEALKKLRKCDNLYKVKLDYGDRKKFLEAYFEQNDIFKNENQKEIDEQLQTDLKEIVEEAKESKVQSKIEDDASIMSLKLKGRSLSGLLNLGVKNIDDLSSINKADIAKVKNIGKASLKEIIDKAHAREIRFADDEEMQIDNKSILQSGIEATELSTRTGAITKQMQQINELQSEKENNDISKKGEKYED